MSTAMLTGSHVEAVEAWWKLLRVDVDTKGCYMAATQQNSKDDAYCVHFNSYLPRA